ncbi:hypothetical protein M0804_003901 [Polistes exclamans]|nr:hypothetical protein M0804_003901 [Polistes exclamans]
MFAITSVRRNPGRLTQTERVVAASRKTKALSVQHREDEEEELTTEPRGSSKHAQAYVQWQSSLYCPATNVLIKFIDRRKCALANVNGFRATAGLTMSR